MRSILFMTVTLAAGGCATRTFPASFPPDSPASLSARETARPSLTTALAGDPLLPGEDAESWPGLDAAAPAQPEVGRIVEQPLDAEAAVRVALRNNRELRAAFHDLGVARGHLVQAGLLPNPTIEGAVPVEPEIRYEVGVEFDLTHALLAPLRAKAAASDLEAARYRTAGAVVAVGFRARSAFYDAQASEQKLTLARRTLDALAAGRDAARALLDAGNIPELGLASQDAAFERARVLVAQLELEVAASREQLHRTLGLHGEETRWRLRGPLAPAPERAEIPGQIERRALEVSLELSETRSRLEGIARRTGLSRAEGWLPEISVSASTAEVEHDGIPHRERRWGAGLTLSVPLFDRKQGRTSALSAEFDALMERYQGMAVEVRSAAREAANRLTSAHARARQYQTVVIPAQQRVTRQTLLQFNAMQVGIFQLLVARREELDAELAHVETLREYWTAAAGLDALLAGRRPGPMTPASAQFVNRSEAAGGH